MSPHPKPQRRCEKEKGMRWCDNKRTCRGRKKEADRAPFPRRQNQGRKTRWSTAAKPRKRKRSSTGTRIGRDRHPCKKISNAAWRVQSGSAGKKKGEQRDNNVKHRGDVEIRSNPKGGNSAECLHQMQHQKKERKKKERKEPSAPR